MDRLRQAFSELEESVALLHEKTYPYTTSAPPYEAIIGGRMVVEMDGADGAAAESVNAVPPPMPVAATSASAPTEHHPLSAAVPSYVTSAVAPLPVDFWSDPQRFEHRIPRLSIPAVVRHVLADSSSYWRRLARELAERRKDAGLQTLCIASSVPGEGATTIAAALTLAVSQWTDMRTVLFDGDYQSPSMATLLGVRLKRGLESYLVGECGLEAVLFACTQPHVAFVGMLHPLQQPELVLNSDRSQALFVTLRRDFDLVIIDAGALTTADAATRPLWPQIDASLIVRNPTLSNDSLILKLRRHLAKHEVHPLGIIENNLPATAY